MTEETKNNGDEWYKEGLRFKCTQCGRCCTGSPGYVWLTEEEMQAMAKYLDMSLTQFTQRYVRKVNGRFSLLEYANQEEWGKYDCVFLKDNRCSIHPVRPKQCRTYPWWPENLASPKHWDKATLTCEGVNHPEGKLYNFEEIQEDLHKQLSD
ncbi:MAG: hypothetical protein K0S74_837 [Chlamydiales bacterium]|jgi:Fe-S-cluster containining protein|nr:hypothetical protein [Chlamydiales bacterium]